MYFVYDRRLHFPWRGRVGNRRWKSHRTTPISSKLPCTTRLGSQPLTASVRVAAARPSSTNRGRTARNHRPLGLFSSPQRSLPPQVFNDPMSSDTHQLHAIAIPPTKNNDFNSGDILPLWQIGMHHRGCCQANASGIRAGVNSAPELELIANSGIGIELELPSLNLELNWNCHHWNRN